jgi:hypothetical protein
MRTQRFPHREVVEHLVRDEGVAGSNPATPTNQINDLLRWGFRKISYGDSYGDRNPLGFVVRSHSNVAWAPPLAITAAHPSREVMSYQVDAAPASFRFSDKAFA